MAVTLKKLAYNKDLLTGGHRACAGCTGANILRQIMLTAGPDTVVTSATGCMEVVTTIYPYTAWKTSFIYSAFENVAATISGPRGHIGLVRVSRTRTRPVSSSTSRITASTRCSPCCSAPPGSL